MSDQFYILSLKHSPDPRTGAAVWWRSEAKGYTTDLSQARVYDLATVESNPGYYNNGETTAAWYKEAVDAQVKSTVEWAKVNPAGWRWELRGTPAVLGYRQPCKKEATP